MAAFELSAADQALGRALAAANQFSLESMSVNRQGRLAAGQVAKLRRSAVVLLAGAAPPALAAAYLAVDIYLHPESRSGLVVFVMGLCVAVGFVILSLVRRIAADLINARVLSLEGIAEKSVSLGGRRGQRHYYVFNEHKFAVSREGYDAIVTGRRYRVYYTPRFRTMVNIEPVT